MARWELYQPDDFEMANTEALAGSPSLQSLTYVYTERNGKYYIYLGKVDEACVYWRLPQALVLPLVA